MKKIAVAILLIMSLGGMLFYIYQLLVYKPYHCDAQIFSNLGVKGDDDDRVEVNTHIDIVYSSSHNGIMKFVGSVKHKGNSYILKRTILFTFAPSELENINKVTFTGTMIHPTDNLPENLWLSRVLPQTPGIEFYSETRTINNNAIIYRGFSNPLVICVRR